MSVIEKWPEDSPVGTRKILTTEQFLSGVKSTHDALKPLYSPIVRDLAHVSTERLQALAKRYELRAKVSANDPKLQMRWHVVLQELGTREIVADIEKDLGEGEQ